MTYHVRTSYRRHRKATWGLAVLIAVAVGAVVIPLATAAGKTYTLTATPTATCASPASTQITLTNTGSPQTLGSAEIYFPPNTVASMPGLRSDTTSSAQPQRKDILGLDNLNLAPGQSRTITVTFKPGVTFSATITAVVKQANRFNDSGGGANLFTLQGSFPKVRVVTCVTVSGRVYQDRNLDNTYTTGTGAFLNSDIPKAWRVDLFAKDVGASSYPSTPAQTVNPSSAGDGSFTFTQVPTGSDYKICVTALNGDSSLKWALQSPSGNTDCAPVSTGGPVTAANRLPNLSANATGQDFLVVPVIGPFGTGDTSDIDGYEVVASSNSTKADAFYVHDTWVDAQGGTNFRFSPVTACAPPSCPAGKIYLLESLDAEIALSALGGRQVELRYDDVPPFLDAELKPMPYCTIDPRQSGGALATSGVLPGTDTSCIVTGQQSVVAGAKVTTAYLVYTAYDGGRRIG